MAAALRALLHTLSVMPTLEELLILIAAFTTAAIFAVVMFFLALIFLGA